ncbi:Arm DNA-binding domain-containing protein [Halomonas sp. WWR20]
MIPKKGSAYWMLRYSLLGKRREMSLGKHARLSLAEARAKTLEHQRSLQAGVDPTESRKQEQQVSIRTVNDLFADWYPDLEKCLKHPHIPKRVYRKEENPDFTLSRGCFPGLGSDRLPNASSQTGDDAEHHHHATCLLPRYQYP